MQGSGDVEVLFLESARLYRLPNDSPGFDQILERLRGAESSQRPVRVTFDSPFGGIIQDVLAGS